MRRAALLIALLTAGVLAASPASAGRPLETEDAGTLAPGDFELELSGDYVRHSDANAWGVLGVLSAGILPRFEARLEMPVLVLEEDGARSYGGLADAVVGIKYRLVDEKPAVPALLAAIACRLPTGDIDRGLGAEEVDVTVLGVLGKRIGSFLLNGNVGYTFVTANRDLDVWTLAASVEYRVTPALSVVGEALGFLPRHRDESATGRVRAGVIYALSDNVRLDAAVGRGLTSGSARALVTCRGDDRLLAGGSRPLAVERAREQRPRGRGRPVLDGHHRGDECLVMCAWFERAGLSAGTRQLLTECFTILDDRLV